MNYYLKKSDIPKSDIRHSSITALPMNVSARRNVPIAATMMPHGQMPVPKTNLYLPSHP
jgi:hypothetical protein